MSPWSYSQTEPCKKDIELLKRLGQDRWNYDRFMIKHNPWNAEKHFNARTKALRKMGYIDCKPGKPGFIEITPSGIERIKEET